MICYTIGMNSVKVSVTINPRLARFARDFQERHKVRTQSEVVERALIALSAAELRAEYAEAALEYAQNEDVKLWDVTVGDGIDVE
jgi:hypothetical protein